MSVVLSGIFIVGRVPALPKCASTRVASIFSAPTQVNLFGTEPSSRFSVIFTALRFSSSLLPNQQQIFEVSEK